MTTHDPSSTAWDPALLSQFTGTQRYYIISPQHVLTDGTHYLCQAGGCFWIMDAVASHLSEIGTRDWFVQVTVLVRDNTATMIYDDGNGLEHARQDIPCCDLPLEQIRLFAAWDGVYWVIMLPSEY